jgi:hypothetical protein
LRLNCLTLWNDYPPVNCQSLIDYAHNRGIKVILGFHWGWGLAFNLASSHDRVLIQNQVLQHFQQFIAPLHPDGIYFQTLTEHNQLSFGDQSVAALACELVNQISARLFQIEPELDIRFGLHATSIRDHYNQLADLDTRVTIVWEDAGALPFSYLPANEVMGISFTQTLEYACSLASFRPGTPFAMVAKGWTTLDWQDEFEHHAPYLIGERNDAFIEHRMGLIRPRWAKVNLLWLKYYQKAQEFYRTVYQASQGNMSVLGLIEDGLFEYQIQPSVSMFAETIWNPFIEPDELLKRAMSQYYLKGKV